MKNWYLKHRKLSYAILAVVVVMALMATGLNINVQQASIPEQYNKPLLLGQIGDTQVILTIGTVEAATTTDYQFNGDVAHDTAVMQSALDTLPSIGGEIQILGTNGLSDNTVTFNATISRAINNVIISGVGNATSFAYDGSNPVFSAGSQSGWTFRDFKTDAGGINYSSSANYVLENITIGASYHAYLTSGNATFTTANATTLNATTATIDTLSSDTGRGATYVIACSDSPAVWKNQAVATLTGTDDQSIINTYLALGDVFIAPGTVAINDYISVPANRIFTCQPNMTTINLANAAHSVLTGDAASGQKDIAIADASGFSPGDYLIMSDDDNCGMYLVDTVVSNTITTTTNLQVQYDVSANAEVWQVYPSIVITGSNVTVSNFKIEGNRDNRIYGRTVPGNGVYYNATMAFDSSLSTKPWNESDGAVVIIDSGAAIDNVHIEHNSMDSMSTMGIVAYSVTNPVTNIYIEYNTLSDIGDKGILQTGDNGSYGYFINHNNINGTGKAVGVTPPATAGYGDGIQFHQNCATEVILESNILRDLGRAGMELTYNASGTEKWVIANNQIYDWGNLTFTSTTENLRRFAIKVYGVAEIIGNIMDCEQSAQVAGLNRIGGITTAGDNASVNIIGNKIKNISPQYNCYPIYGYNLTNSNICDNEISGVGSDNNNRTVIYFDSTGIFENVNISGNQVSTTEDMYVFFAVDIDSPQDANKITITENNVTLSRTISKTGIGLNSTGTYNDVLVANNNINSQDAASLCVATTGTYNRLRVYGNNYLVKGEIRTISKAITAGVQNTVTSIQNNFGGNVVITEAYVSITAAASATNPTYDMGTDDDGAGAPSVGNNLFEAIPDTAGYYRATSNGLGGDASGVLIQPIIWPTTGNDWVNFIITDADGADTAGIIYITVTGL